MKRSCVFALCACGAVAAAHAAPPPAADSQISEILGQQLLGRRDNISSEKT
jgi:hypothetical protein